MSLVAIRALSFDLWFLACLALWLAGVGCGFTFQIDYRWRCNDMRRKQNSELTSSEYLYQ